MTIQLTRRSLLIGGGLILAAPAVVRAASLMPVRMVNLFPGGITYIVKYDIEKRAWIVVGTKAINGVEYCSLVHIAARGATDRRWSPPEDYLIAGKSLIETSFMRTEARLAS